MLTAFVAVPVSSASAQRRPPEPPPKVMISTFASSDKDLGIQAAEALRSRISRDIDDRRLTVIPKADINNTLTASGYSTTEALQPNDAKALANLLRADEYVEGTVSKTPTGFKIDARLVLARDNTIQQPLPAAEGSNLDRAAQAVSRSYAQAREQLAGERNCSNLVRERKYQEAVLTARSGLSKYPTGTIAMVCLMNAYQGLTLTDSVLAVSERITTTDPRNIAALRFKAEIYQTRNNTEKATEALTALMAADPSNERLRDQVIASLASTGQAAKAVPFVEEAIRANPGDPKTLALAWRVYLAAQQYEKALTTGADLIKADTAAADSSYFIRSASAAAQLGPTRAAPILAQGVARFPNNASLLIVQANALSKAGQNAQALAAARRAVQVNPKVEGGYAQLALIYSALNQPDSVI
ncbi:MAG TPA: BTAD domain-containing putative transcriptional regulator, partial [Gemmatimonadaceae bacterium]|nr:BTAD domain-containing putative transcriptional regulator [Gemmatimonadaceae bacterium]